MQTKPKPNKYIPWYKMINYYDFAMFIAKILLSIWYIFLIESLTLSNVLLFSIYFTLCTQFLALSLTHTHADTETADKKKCKEWMNRTKKKLATHSHTHFLWYTICEMEHILIRGKGHLYWKVKSHSMTIIH